MTQPGNRTLEPAGSPARTPERIREVARWDEEMRGKARACAERGGYTEVTRMVSRPAGSHVQDTNGQWTRTTEESWAGEGNRGDEHMLIVVSASGTLTATPAAAQAR